MSVPNSAKASRARLSIVVAACIHAGMLITFVGPIAACGLEVLPVLGDGSRPTLGSSIGDDLPSTVENGTNHVLEMAQLVDVGDGPQAIRGAISSAGDVDVYNLGPVAPGDRVRVEVETAGDLLGAVGLFDDTGCTLLINDHRNYYLGRQGPFIDLTVRRPSTSCLVAIAGTPGFDSAGGYELAAAIEFPAPVPQPRRDVFVLDFDGGRNVRIGNRAPVNVPEFDAAVVLPDFEGLTSTMIEQIVSRVRRDFEGYDVTIYSTSDSFADDDDAASRVYFGTYDPALLGVAEGVDEYNADSAQNAIVFTDTFQIFENLRPSVASMSQAIANVASHEIGHLLGLVHTRDPADVMDVSASLRQLLEDQDFRRAEIHSTVFPLGDQDSAQMLLDAVGGDPSVLLRDDSTAKNGVSRFRQDSGPPARGGLPLGGCGLGGGAN